MDKTEQVEAVMIIFYLLSGPVFAAIVFVALMASEASSLAALTGSLVAGFLAPVLMACLYFVYKSKFHVKLADKSQLKAGQ